MSLSARNCFGGFSERAAETVVKAGFAPVLIRLYLTSGLILNRM
jgi:hypothetical protein